MLKDGKKDQKRQPNWYKKPRSGFIFGLSNWILSEPKACGIVLVMGHIVSVILFGLLLGLAVWLNWNNIFKAIVGGLFLITLRNLYKYYKFKKETGGLVTESMNDMLFKGKIK